jgi:multimeric flavodoxin WrbA
MKVLALSFSPRPAGNTVQLLETVLGAAAAAGAATELWKLAGKTVQPCDGCNACRRTGACHIQDDMEALYPKLLEADAIIFGTPVYFYNMTGQGKTVIDRTIALGRPGRNLANKVGGVVCVAGSFGLADTVKDLYFYMVTRQMLPAMFVAAYAGARGDVKHLPKCQATAADLGRQVVAMAVQGFKYPADIEAPHFAYGTHTK